MYTWASVDSLKWVENKAWGDSPRRIPLVVRLKQLECSNSSQDFRQIHDKYKER